MQIAGIQKLTLVDFPGHVAATIFTRGCNFRCGFCHNPELVLPDHYNPLLDEKQLFEFLESRYGKLNGICITGGEPLLQPDIKDFITHMKALGFKVKLDTNGSFPDKLKEIIEEGEVDYIAMDVKTTLGKYPSVVIPNSLLDSGSQTLITKIQKSIKLIINSGISYEFRTTVSHPTHQIGDFKEIGEMLATLKNSPPAGGGVRGGGSKQKPLKYFIQNYVNTKQINPDAKYTPFTDEELEEAKKIMEGFVEEVGIR